MKKYMYHVLDTDERVYANSGDEFDKICMSTHRERPAGPILLVNLESQEKTMMYPFKF